MSLVKLHSADKDTLIEVKVHDEIRVYLPENPTTGFEWILENNDTDILSLQKVEYEIPKNSFVGSGGQKVFYFQGENKGMVQPQFKLCRPWLGGESAEDYYSVIIKVGN
ncbi:MAG: protease inhibitor I42 family protein [Crocosphaera sp.]|nr:protease inhibitor I42 family protein [Crocosphaera sp.]